MYSFWSWLVIPLCGNIPVHFLMRSQERESSLIFDGGTGGDTRVFREYKSARICLTKFDFTVAKFMKILTHCLEITKPIYLRHFTPFIGIISLLLSFYISADWQSVFFEKFECSQQRNSQGHTLRQQHSYTIRRTWKLPGYCGRGRRLNLIKVQLRRCQVRLSRFNIINSSSPPLRIPASWNIEAGDACPCIPTWELIDGYLWMAVTVEGWWKWLS